MPMKFGITAFLTDYSIGPDELGREVEARGFDSLFVPEHTHIPSARKTPAPMGEPLPRRYSHALDPFVALTMVAAATQTLRIGTGICLVAQRDPFVLAKEVATLDLVSRGRFVFGVGFGWNREEIEHHGVPFAQRREVSAEKTMRPSTADTSPSSRRGRGRSRCRSRTRRPTSGAARATSSSRRRRRGRTAGCRSADVASRLRFRGCTRRGSAPVAIRRRRR
jgi:hypothetical protein